MFLKESAVKKIIKGAYSRSELFIANLKMDYIIYCSRWIIQIDKKSMPNKIKGAIIELTGEFPEQGEKKCYGPDNEYVPEVEKEEKWEKVLDVGTAVCSYTITSGMYERNGNIARIIQTEDGNKYAVSENVVAAVKCNEDVYGPLGRDNQGGKVIWYDDNCLLMAFTVESDKEKEILDRMASINLPDRYHG